MDITTELNNKNLMIFAAKHYYTPKCIDSDQFFEDLKRFKYVKRLLNRYKDTGELSERLLLNHLIVIFNVFGFPAGIRILDFKIQEDEHWSVLKPFLIFLKAIDEYGLPQYEMDQLAVERLRDIKGK
jgi:hypothetical protein